MTDRELLELAARAAGIHVRWHETWECFVHAGPFKITNPPTRAAQRQVWAPLDDDGDALRLAVRLRLHASQFPILDDGFDVPHGMVEVWRVDDDGPLHVEFLRSGDDRLDATRRAIVRAAAEIGRNMP